VRANTHGEVTELLSTVFAFVFLLSVLIFVHELGHFLVAKACGVRVLKFSLGFGPPVGIGRFRLQWQRGHTEYVVAWFPLGGFVKMLGESPDEIDNQEALAHPSETLNSKPLWQKLAVVFAGPAMNLILPVCVFVATLYVGLPQPAAVIGMIEIGSPAQQAGLHAGDRIVAIDGEPTAWWREVAMAVRDHPGKRLDIAVDRDGERSRHELQVDTRSAFDEFNAVTSMGWAGFAHPRQRPLLGIPDAETAAARAGLRSGDLVSAVNGEPVEDWIAFRDAIGGAAGEALLDVKRSVGDGEEALQLALRVEGAFATLGIVPASVLVAAVDPGSPADEAGFEPGDLIFEVDGAPVGSFGSFAEIVRTGGGEPLELSFARNGEAFEASVTPALKPIDIGLGIEEPRYLIGIRGSESLAVGAFTLDRERNPLVAVPRAVALTGDITRTFLHGLGKMVTGEVSRKNLGGPIAIAEVAGNAFEEGWETYLRILVLISINLAILNLMPIPILDGGQALLFIVEGVKRSPLSLRSREIVQSIGLTMLMMLMGLAFWNDISRHWSKVIDWLRSGPGL
jgi:regulator of sigma E protease